MRATIRPLWAAYELKCEQRFWGGMLVLFRGDEVVLKDVLALYVGGGLLGGVWGVGGVLGVLGVFWRCWDVLKCELDCLEFWGYRGRLKGGDGGIFGVLGRFGVCLGALRGVGVFWGCWGRLEGGFRGILGVF